MSLFMMWKNQQVSNSGSRENNKAPSFFLGALNPFLPAERTESIVLHVSTFYYLLETNNIKRFYSLTLFVTSNCIIM